MTVKLPLALAAACLLAGCAGGPRQDQRVVIRNFALPWSDKPAPRTECRLEVRDGRLHFAFEAEDHDIVVAPEWHGETTLDGEDRVEVFFAADDALRQYWCIEMDAQGRVHDYAASHYRKFDSAWNCDGLETFSRRTADGYAVSASIPLATLRELLGVPVGSGRELRLGLFRAEFYGRETRTRGEAPDNWLSWARPNTKQPDFHVPSAFRLLRLP